MSQQELLNRVVLALQEVGIPFMLTGSLASSLQGEPRSTHDIDLVVALSPAALPPLVACFPESDFYLDAAAARDAIKTGGMFNMVEFATGDKVDFWMLTDDPFDRTRFERRIRVPIDDLEVDVSTPEDTVVKKLHWAHLSGGSEKELADVRSIVEVQGAHLDRPYIDHWAAHLGVTDLWLRVKLPPGPD